MTDDIILKAVDISKQYRLGQVGTGTLSHDLNRWWHSIRGKEDPYLKIGDVNNRAIKGQSDYVWALKDINFEVRRGEVLGIIGKNGAGKSTLLKILSKVTSPTTGVIKSKGRIASLLEVGTGFNPELTGRENIFLNGAILGMTKKEISSKIAEIIDFSGCERYIDTPTKRYSSGMTVRLAFAVAAFLEPEILVIDEVLAVGDAEFQKKAIGKMQDISRQGGRTVLFVSHNMAAVKSLCTRGVVIENGMIVFSGSTEDSILYYLNENTEMQDFRNVSGRKGNGVVKFDKVEVYGSQKSILPQVGMPFTIDITLQNQSKKSSVDVRIDLRIDDSMGQRIFWISNYLKENTKYENLKNIKFVIEKLNLNQGIYYVTLYMETNSELSDYIQNAFNFEVIDGDYYGTGRQIPQKQSKVISDFNVNYK